MKSILLNGNRQVNVIETPTPVAFDNYAVVRIKSAPMCTEYRKYAAGESCNNLGHEAAGEVVESFAGSKVKPGDRVMIMPQYPCGECELCRSGDYIHCEHVADPLNNPGLQNATGTFAEYIIKPDWLLLPIPDDLTYNEAAMACCGLGPALQAAESLGINSEDTVLVTGLGPVGLGAIICCTLRGARVIGISNNEYRRKLAVELGATVALDPHASSTEEQVMTLTGNGANKSIECSGDQHHQLLALHLVKRKGQVAFIGESPEMKIDLSNLVLRKGLILHGIWHWNLNHYEKMISTIRASKEKLHKMITHTFPLHEAEEAFKLQLTGNCGKVVLQP